MSGSNILKRCVIGGTAFFTLIQMTLPSLIMAQTGSKRVSCEVAILRASPEVAKQIQLQTNDNPSAKVAIESITQDSPTIKNNSVAMKTTTKYKEQLPAYVLTKGEYQQLVSLLQNSQGCSVSDSVRSKTTRDGKATGFDGTARTYCVSSKKHQAKFGTVVSVPEYQVVEDGIIVKHQLKGTANGLVDVDSQIVINEVLEVNTFTFEGATKPVTLELAKTSARQLKISADVSPDQVLLVASPYIDNTIEQPVAKEPFLSNVPYVNRLFKNVGVGRDSCVLYYAISVSR